MKQGVLGRAMGHASIARQLRKAARSKDQHVADRARAHVAARMGKLRGLPQKIGQMLSMAGDADNAAPATYEHLTNAADPLPFPIIEDILEHAWGRPINEVLAEVDEVGHAASLGQVHRATLHDGREVAIKVAYPGIRQAVMSDLKLLGWVSAPVGDLRRGFDLADYRQEIMRNLEEELDYRTELKNQMLYREQIGTELAVVVPDTLAELSTEQVLVTHWEDGSTISDACQWPEKTREQLARCLLRHFMVTLFQHGYVHADPHPGNYRFRQDPQGGPSYTSGPSHASGPSVVLYDFGSVVRISQRDRLLLLRLITDTIRRRGNPMAWLVELGFTETLLSPIQAKLPAVCSVLFEPFGQIAKFDVAAWKRKERIDDILGDDRWNFRMAGPAKMILLMRAFRGVLYYLERLAKPVSWERVFTPTAAPYASQVAGLNPPPCAAATPFDAMAKHLRVQVLQGGAQKVLLTMPLGAIDDLAGVMDEDLIRRIEADGTHLEDVVRTARANGYAPAELFSVDSEEDKHVRVWIE